MVNLDHKLTIDDLIVEYMIYKVRNGYEPKFLTSEFISFLYFFETKMQVVNSLYDNEALFKRFFDRKAESDWSTTKNLNTGEKDISPHMNKQYSENENDYIISANYKLSDYDRSVINTYFMDHATAAKIRNIKGEYLAEQPKRKIEAATEVNENDILTGNYIAAEIITQIWNSHISHQIENHTWPKQCTDINKYLFEIDLAKIIDAPSIKNELIELYNVLSKRIVNLYHLDKNLKVSSYSNSYLARANYELLIQGYEKTMGIAFGPYKKSLEFDLSSSIFKESHEIDGVYYWDDDPDIKTTTTAIENDKVKKLVRFIEKEKQKV